MLCQIEHCCQYGNRFGRVVVVDTASQHLENFRDEFGRYFVSNQKGRLKIGLGDLGIDLDALSAVPGFIQGRINSYRTQNFREMPLPFKREVVTRRPVSFDFGRPYHEDLLVHEASGGGQGSFHAVKRLTITQQVADGLLERLEILGDNYSAVHIRNTDLVSDIGAICEQLRRIKFTKLFVATDRINVLAELRAGLPHVEVLSFACDLSIDGHPVHVLDAELQSGCEEIQRRNQDAILDLLTLAMSSELVTTQIKRSWWGSVFSGYSVLARNLWANPPILRAFLNDPRFSHYLSESVSR